jgi:CRISPR-associated protein Cmr5
MPDVQIPEPVAVQKTTEQKRAAAAWGVVTQIATAPYAGRFKALVRGFPASVLTNGLGHALVFLQAKPGEQYHALYGALNDWVGSHIHTNRTDLLEWLIEHDSDQYRRATTECLAYIVWLKRFAEAKIQGEEEP